VDKIFYRVILYNEYSLQRIYLSFGSPCSVLGRHPYRAESVDGDTEDGVDGAKAGGVVER